MDSATLAGVHHPTPARPLLGMTVLAVEDSRFACETLRRMCLRSGARLRRADCLQSARRHLTVYRPTIVLVDLGLPDGNGAELIADLARATPRAAAILAMSGDTFWEDVAIAAGADGFMTKPVASLAEFQNTILRYLPRTMRPYGMRPVVDETIASDPLAYRDDLAHASDLLHGTQDGRTLGYVAQFLSGVARAAGDDGLASAAASLTAALRGGDTHDGLAQRLSALVDTRLQDRIAI
ncbi:MAG: response regulator [Roseivivax sp.]|nr:response regulator [Roseivivax sp.]